MTNHLFMNLKTDTKEKFAVIRLLEGVLTENMAEELEQMLLARLDSETPHLVLNLAEVERLDDVSANTLANCQQKFYEAGCSFVICCLTPNAEQVFEKLELLELLNVTPTESEAGDIVQMEEIEREILGGEDDESDDVTKNG